jgi:acetate kinase
MAVLVVNAGSSSLKFQLFGVGADGPVRQVKGLIEGIGTRPWFKVSGDGVAEDRAAPEAGDVAAAVRLMLSWLGPGRFAAVGHRVVHGGPDHAAPVVVDDGVLAGLEALVDLAPLHQPGNLAPIRMIRELAPDVPQVACFDTAFHRGHPEVADTYALPAWMREAGVRRYGFHGLSYAYVADRLRVIAPDLRRVIVAHLGNGASMCALVEGQSVESTMGFTALDGLVMGTRPGQLDPGVVLWMMARGMSAGEASDLLYRQSGLKALSGGLSDMRDLLASDDPRAAMAVEVFIHRAVMQAGAMAAAMGGVDGIVFTAGIGENAAAIRARIVGQLGWMGATLDGAANEAGAEVISAPGSAVRVMVVPTDEEVMIARQVVDLLPQGVDKAGAHGFVGATR